MKLAINISHWLPQIHSMYNRLGSCLFGDNEKKLDSIKSSHQNHLWPFRRMGFHTVNVMVIPQSLSPHELHWALIVFWISDLDEVVPLEIRTQSPYCSGPSHRMQDPLHTLSWFTSVCCQLLSWTSLKISLKPLFMNLTFFPVLIF